MQDGVEYEKVIVRITSKIRAGYYTVKSLPIRESSFNMTRGVMKILRGGSENF